MEFIYFLYLLLIFVVWLQTKRRGTVPNIISEPMPGPPPGTHFNTRATHTHAHSRRAHASERSTSGATADEHNPLWSAEEYRAVQEAEELKRKVYVLFTISWYLPSFMADSAHQA
jgi:hypothetical protein